MKVVDVVCPTGKIRYRSEDQASRELASTRRPTRFRRRRHERRAYQCDVCHGWHLTSQRLRGGQPVDPYMADTGVESEDTK